MFVICGFPEKSYLTTEDTEKKLSFSVKIFHGQ
jgi:hypothetical protein